MSILRVELDPEITDESWKGVAFCSKDVYFRGSGTEGEKITCPVNTGYYLEVKKSLKPICNNFDCESRTEFVI